MKLSLRARLIFAAVSLVAVGLIAASATTYTVLRNSLLSRVDEQLSSSRGWAVDALDRPPDFPNFGRHGAGPASSITFVGLLDDRGSALIAKPVGFPGTAVPQLNLPGNLPGSSSTKDTSSTRYFTASSPSGQYRVLATAVSYGDSLPGTFLVASPLAEVQRTLHGLVLIEGFVAVLVLAAVAGLALWLVRIGLRPLTQMEGTAAEIAAGDLTRRVEPAEPGTEVGRLGLALNAMLSKIEAAFAERQASEAKLRRFVADASHELRTPLTSIRGYAELFRHGAEERPGDLTKSMRRIEEESTRMGELVDELLLLARLDQGRPLERVPVDLARIAHDAVEDARAVDPVRPIDIAAPPEAVVSGDDARLRQVAANLLTNALEHTPAGTPVHLRLRIDGNEAALEVADEGPGLAPDDADKVFDRFFRVDPSRTRGNGGAGLGLSIVAAIIHAHGGRVSLLTSPGAGARFIVTIPLATSSTSTGVEPSRT
jgi:two-component system, OmpR family, sensor kinase